jgi:hypothetical protein
MCVEGWKRKEWNPAGVRVVTREQSHKPEALDLRGGVTTGGKSRLAHVLVYSLRVRTILISLEGTLGSSSLFPSPRALEACTLIPSVFIFIAYHSKMLNEAVGRIGSSWLLSSLFCSLATPALVMLIHVPAFDLPSLPAAGRGDELQDSFVSDIQRYASSMDWEGALAAGRAGSWMGVDSLWKKVVGE